MNDPMMRALSSFLWLGVALAGAVFGQETHVPFRPDLPAGAAYVLDAARLHPTQFALGLREVVAKQKAIDAMTPDKLVAYLKDKDVPVVIGPGGTPYMTDGHHTLRALLDSAQPDKSAYGHILANWAAVEPAAFWKRMAAQNYTYLKDASGRGPQPPASLPASLKSMQSDPYRGLAWGVMKAGGFDEVKGVFFQEFLWADYFRAKVSWDDASDAAFAEAVQKAAALAREPAAAGLPGYKVGPLKPRAGSAPTKSDTAIWINPADRAKSLVVVTERTAPDTDDL
jgi:hypothetical protein